MSGLDRLKKLEKVYAEKMDPIYRVWIEDKKNPIEYLLLTPRYQVIDAEQYAAWKEKIIQSGKPLEEYYHSDHN